MSGRSALARGAAAVAVFAVAFAVGDVMGEDDRPAAKHAPAKSAALTADLGPLRLERAPGLPELRAVPARPKPKPKPAPAAPAGVGPAAPPAEPPAQPAGETEAGGYVAPTPTPPVSSSPPANPAPAAPPPPSEPPPASTDAPQPAAPAPDPAPDWLPAPEPVPGPDPSPSGGSGQFSGP